jgi:hypothetical protein
MLETITYNNTALETWEYLGEQSWLGLLQEEGQTNSGVAKNRARGKDELAKYREMRAQFANEPIEKGRWEDRPVRCT